MLIYLGQESAGYSSANTIQSAERMRTEADTIVSARKLTRSISRRYRSRMKMNYKLIPNH